MARSKGLRFAVTMGLAAAAVAAMGAGTGRAEDRGRPAEEIQKDLNAARTALRGAAPEDQAVNPEYREKLREKIVPLLAKCDELYRELFSAKPAAKNDATSVWDLTRAQLAYFGDKDQMAGLKAEAASKNSHDAMYGKLSLLFIRWWNAAGDEREQGKILDEVAPIVKAHSRDSEVAGCVKMMVDQNPASAAIASRIEDIVATSDSKWAKSYGALPNLVGKPLVVEGHDLAGKPFSTERWKGKVVMVDFWASWCKPCDQQEPLVAALYKKYHGKGLEIVGVNSDVKRGQLEAFMNSHPGMDWPELFTEGNKALDPTATSFGITGIPVAYFIDRNGILRTTNGDREMEEWIEKLLAEKHENARER